PLPAEDLRLPNIATWWCGQGQARRSVIADMDELAIAGAFGNPILGFARNQPLVGAELDAQATGRLPAATAERGVDFVGQDLVNLPTPPVWNAGRIERRPFVLRVYAARTPEG